MISSENSDLVTFTEEIRNQKLSFFVQWGSRAKLLQVRTNWSLLGYF